MVYAEVPPADVEQKVVTFRQGDRCVVDEKHHGAVMFVGHLADLGPGVWVGIQYDEPVGKCNGRAPDGRQIFRCPNRHGGFSMASDVALEQSVDEQEAASAPAVASTDKPGKRKKGAEANAAALADEASRQIGNRGASQQKSAVEMAAEAQTMLDKAKARVDAAKSALLAASPSGKGSSGGGKSAGGGGANKDDQARLRAELARATEEEELAHEMLLQAQARAQAEAARRAQATLQSSAQHSFASGRGLHTAVVGQLAQFMITAVNADAKRRETGGEGFHCMVRGLRPPSNLRVRMHDLGNGTYAVDYRPEMTGDYLIAITLDGTPIRGARSSRCHPSSNASSSLLATCVPPLIPPLLYHSP